jgi:osmotically-inducible protein OsmY
VVTLAASIFHTPRARAVEIAGSLMGVRQVVDKLVVKS